MSQDLRKKLKEARKKLGLSQAAAAREWGIPVRTLIGWENDQRTPRTFAMKNLTALLDGILSGETGDPSDN
jgi:DNA-binding transcriptional regulator YiaG